MASSSVQFAKLNGEPIDCKVPAGCTVREATPLVSRVLGGYGGIHFVTESGVILQNEDVLPEEGVVQVQRMAMAEGTWSKLYRSAVQGFEEERLRNSLTEAWPGDFNGHDNRDFENWQKEVFEVITQAAVKSEGDWIDYWTFGHAACSYGYWYTRPPYETREPSVNLILNDVKRWQKLILDLEPDFAELRSRTAGMALGEHVEVAVASLLRYCPDFTTNVHFHVGFEMWYQPFSELVGWYLSSVGFDDVKILEATENAIVGFNSYSVPRDAAFLVAKQVGTSLGFAYTRLDSTSEWLAVRSSLANLEIKHSLSELPLCEKDSHLLFINSVDASRDASRADNLRHALSQCRKDAAAGDALKFAHLQIWQKYLVPSTSYRAAEGGVFRKHDAYAKRGRECYPIDRGTEDRFKELLEQANDESKPLALRAARAYLDVCFFHPFDDANSRMARLVFDFILTRAGVVLQTVDPVFLFGKSAKDGVGAVKLVEVVSKLLCRAGDGWNAQLNDWEAKNPFPGFAELSKTTWFACMGYPEDVPP
mmetsp:Transcript_29049/g.68455  ORF Transcript_29049/g.68455 Transcript_29049/m.68455 type:complete len:536 (+) Transcript_29049:29-1636(+)